MGERCREFGSKCSQGAGSVARAASDVEGAGLGLGFPAEAAPAPCTAKLATIETTTSPAMTIGPTARRNGLPCPIIVITP